MLYSMGIQYLDRRRTDYHVDVYDRFDNFYYVEPLR